MIGNIIQLDGSKCKACYSCIRTCPVKAIHVRKNSVFPHIEESRCINCGVCLDTCAYNAISYLDSTQEVKMLLNSSDKVAAICAPSITGEFTEVSDYRKLVKMIRLLGFNYVTEMSFGVDIIAKKYKELTSDNFIGRYYITSNCPVVVNLVEKIYPDLTDSLVPYVSPAFATALAIRNIYGKDIKIVHITPCVAAKKEISKYDEDIKIDSVLTFQELRKLFNDYNIRETFSEHSDFDEPLGYKGRAYSISSGFMETSGLETDLLNGQTITAEGAGNSIAAVKQFLSHNIRIKRNFNVFFCDGCIMGPGTSKSGEKYLRQSMVIDYMKEGLENFDLEKWNQNIKKYSKSKQLETKFSNKKYALPVPGEYEFKIALNNITQKNNHKEVNCGACGFETCKGLAKAIAQNIAIPEMCVTSSQIGNREITHSMKKTAEELKMTKDELEAIREELDETRDSLSSKSEALSLLIRKLTNGVVLANEQLKVVESNLAFIDILGEEVKDIHEVIPYLIGADLKTLIPSVLISQLTYLLGQDEAHINRDVEIEGKLINVMMFQLIPNKLVGAIFRNLHSEEERPEEIIHRVNEIIEENLRQVQQMGFILGEGAAKTEKMLNTIIKSYK